MRASGWVAAVAAVVAAATAATTGAIIVTGRLPGAAVPATSGVAAVTPAPGVPSRSTPPVPAPPLQVTAVTHAGDSTPVPLLGAVTLTFSAPVDAADVHPALTPELPGAWSQPTPTTLAFTPTAVPLPLQVFTLTVPAGTRGTAGGVLGAATTATWTTRAADPVRLQELLAEDGYLPLSFTPAVSEPASADALAATAFAAVWGAYAWRFAPPPTLRALYTGAQSALLTRGAVLAFEADHHLGTDGIAGPAVWSALTTELATGARNAAPYTYVLVDKALPQQLTVFRNGQAVLTTPANTGVSGAPTPDGSWAVYARYTSQTMSGTNPDGTHYSDPGVPWISYFYGGDAVHGFTRASYGTPQSVGCVELPVATAKQVYDLMGYGDIVTVAG